MNKFQLLFVSVILTFIFSSCQKDQDIIINTQISQSDPTSVTLNNYMTITINDGETKLFSDVDASFIKSEDRIEFTFSTIEKGEGFSVEYKGQIIYNETEDGLHAVLADYQIIGNPNQVWNLSELANFPFNLVSDDAYYMLEWYDIKMTNIVTGEIESVESFVLKFSK